MDRMKLECRTRRDLTPFVVIVESDSSRTAVAATGIDSIQKARKERALLQAEFERWASKKKGDSSEEEFLKWRKKKASVDLRRNPLTGDERKQMMIASNETNFISRDHILVSSGPFRAFVQIREMGYEPKVYVVGSDRDDGGYKAIERYATETGWNDGGKPIKIEMLSKGLQRDDSDTPKGVSGTIARMAVEFGRFDEFKKATGIDSDAAARRWFDRIADRMGVHRAA